MALLQCCCSDAQSVALTWTPSASPNISGYNIYYGTISGTYTNQISTGNVTSLTISNLVFGTTYYFAAATVNKSGVRSALSSEVSMTVSTDPSITVTNVTNGMVVSSSPFTVTGLATDDVGLSDVYYSLNGGAYTVAALIGNQWNATLNLAIGTNTLAVYVADIDGTDSATDTVNIVYAPTTTLIVQTNGDGTVSPNYNGSLLQVGQPYQMTATGINGFMFTNWTGGTTGNLTLYTNGPTARFTMSSNLVMQANFVDTNKPFLNITNITSGMQVTNGAFTVMGVATDNVAVAAVYYSLDGASYAPATISANNWSALLMLASGTNTVGAYAVDAAGNSSATDTVKIIYAPVAALRVQTNGEGIISPNYNGSFLQIGSIYTMTATAVNGFTFTNWTGGTSGSLSLYTNGPAVQFTMSSNLVMQANFVDTTKPFLSITNITAGMQESNGTFTVMGVSTDNVAVAEVYYSLDGAPYATAGINGAQWSAVLTPTPGTNTVAAYAVDTSGNVSATASVTFDYVVSAAMTVQTNGDGTVSPNYNGSLLQIGQNYAMTATAVNGFTFTNWTGGTSGNLALYTNGPTAQFSMSSNLVMQANFIDTTKPFVSITNITSGMQVSNGTFTVMGVATDNVAVAEVYYSFDGAPYMTAGISGAKWSAVLTPVPGTNTVTAYAVDTSGNVSVTASATFDYLVVAAMTVQTNGDGTVSPNYNGSLLQIGQNYTMTATAVNGFTFTNWTAGTVGNLTLYTNSPTAQFMMSSNLVMQANFMDTTKPFVSITNITSGMQESNVTFTVMGVATDNVAVAEVYYSLDGAPYATAGTSGTKWSAVLTPTPGTNTVTAYAVDTSGNVSATASVNFDYVVVAAMTVQTNGDGIVSPNYNGSLLQIGQNYIMTATAVNGFTFTNWTAGTGGNLTLYTNGPTAQFMMSSNLVMQANFMDTTKPFLSITNITAGMQESNGTFTVMGVATDNVAVAEVYYSLDGAPYATAGTSGAQWNAVLAPTPGTNTVTAYAVDTSGNVSATASVNFDYVVVAAMTVQTNGDGIVSPNYNGSLLQIGQNYIMTATAVNGFTFTNWTAGTGGNLTLYTNGPTAQFMMSSNLVMQANFMDTTKPFLSITNITAGMQESNGTFTVMGVATDNVAVAEVYYSLDGAPYATAGTSGAQWNAVLAPTPGTNTVTAYAVDTSGNVSATASATFDYVLSAVMTVQTNGNGTITPNYNGSLLQIGSVYTMTATAGTEFMFTNWTEGTGGNLVLYTNGPVVQFTMSSNLVMQANFVQTNRPSVNITNITSGMQVTNATFTVMGVATDSVAVYQVYFSLDSAPYEFVSPYDGTWFARLTLTPGSNTIAAYAMNEAGNLSATDTVNIDYTPLGTLIVQTNGDGTVSPNLNGSVLQIGDTYTMSAIGVNGFMFTNWTGTNSVGFTFYTNSPTAQFTMSSNLVMLANFVQTNTPSLAITNVTPGMQVSNGTFTVMGVATDNVAVADVYYSLNSAPYSLATTSSDGWYAQVSLASGNNTVSAYAVNDAGKISPTNTAKLDYVVSSTLTVKSHGRGIIGPNLNGSRLQIGASYSMTATASSGFVLTNWTGGTNGTITIYTNGPTVQFTMVTNLEMDANFMDTLTPSLAITNVTSGMLWTNSSFTVMGVATDDEAVASVNYSLNGAPYTEAVTNGIEWSATLPSLVWGTNTFSVYAQATNGNLSATDTVDLVYVVSNELTVVTNGKAAIITPNYAGQYLRIGQNYTMAEAPIYGFVFTNWTGGPIGGPYTKYTSLPTVTFMMSSNLEMQANYIDTLKPYLAITNVTSGMLWTNSAFTVMGVATDDEAVASVNYSYNGAPYTTAATNGAQWSVALPSLNWGTNTFSVYVQATNGNLTATDTVDLVYVVSNELTVVTNGKAAIITPNYAGQPLRIGLNYTMTEAPIYGFVFTNWTGGPIGGPYTKYTSLPTVTFMMSSNLEMQANYIDTLKPYLAITNVTSGMLWTNSSFTVMGVATDDEAVASVNYSYNGAPYTTAATNGAQWSVALPSLNWGTNTFSVYVQATNGNLTATDTVDLVYVVSNELTVVTNGKAAIIAPNYAGQYLRDGLNYTMTEAPIYGFVFTNWTGGPVGGPYTNYTKLPTVTFMMSSNLEMQANYIDTLKPYLAITNVTSGMLWTNSSFTVMGVATDDEAVASVNYSYNGAPYTAAATNGAQWSVALPSLAWGTNTFSVYAQATNGNLTATDTVDLVYVVSNELTVVTNGKAAIIAPNYAGQYLRIGQNYTMAEAPIYGFVFTNWSGGPVGGPYTNYTKLPTVTFMMSSNLEMQANYIDTLKPYLAITNVTSGMLWTNSSFTVMGVATDDEAVASVNYSYNGAPYTAAATNGAQWSVALPSLNWGTNTFSVYAQATNGNLTATDTVDLVYVVSNELTVVTNGKAAIIAPNYAGQYLRIGQNYTMAEAPIYGFVFTNWSGGPVGGPYTNYTKLPTVTFMMSSNLEMQANYIDTLKPYLAITNVTSGMLWTNSSFTVMGVATDDEAVASVNYSYNGAPYTAAATNGAQWSVALPSLAWGTNTFSVYAQATNGNLTATDTVDLVYVVSNELTVVTNGKAAIIAPNYAGQYLRIGQNYTMAEAPIYGFVFTNWSGGPVGGPYTNYTSLPTVTFMMSSNLEMQANYIDTLKPYLAITNVTSGMLWTNSSFTVMGVATDDEAVASVNYSYNGAHYTNATINGVQWSAALTNLLWGTNTFSVYAQATNGNLTATNTVDLVYAVSNQLTVSMYGLGIVSPNYSNAWLRIGQNYTMSAIPCGGFIFSNWDISTNFIGGVKTNTPVLQFMMASNLTLQANFTEVLTPTLTVMSPASGSRATNGLAMANGLAHDIWGVAGVSYQLNNGPWNLMATTNAYTNWASAVQLVAGTNVIRIYAENLGGKNSATNTFNVISTNAFTMQFGMVSRPQTGNGFGLNLDVPPGVSGRIEYSTNLINWTILTNFVGTNGVITIYDPAATDNRRFYRAVVP